MPTHSIRHHGLFLFHALTAVYWFFLTLLLWLPDPRVLLWGWEPAEGPSGLAHIITFSLLGLLVELGRRQKSLLFWTGVLVGYAFVTEIVQMAIPYRSFEWEDIAQDLVGACLGLRAGHVLRLGWAKLVIRCSEKSSGSS